MKAARVQRREISSGGIKIQVPITPARIIGWERFRGSVMAEYLGIPVVIRAKSIDVQDGNLKVERVVANGSEVFEVPIPALVTLSNEMGQARIPAGRGIIIAAKKQFPKWGAADVGAEASKTGSASVRNSLVKLFIPSYQRTCEIVSGKDPAEAAATLAEKILAIKP